MTKIEQVARAIFAADQASLPTHVQRHQLDDLDEASGVASRYRSLARAAIRAMREPTDEMYDGVTRLDKMWREMSSAEVFRAMVDGAYVP